MVYTSKYDNYSAYLIDIKPQEPAPIETTIAALNATKPAADATEIYVVTGTFTTKAGTEPANNTYGNGTLSDAEGNSIVLYGLSGSNACLTFADGKYTYKNAKDFLTLGVVDGSVIKVGMVYTSKYDNYSAYLIEIVNGEEGGETPEQPEPSTEPAAVETTIAALAATAPETSFEVIYIVEGTWKTKDGVVASSNTYGNGTLSDKDGNSVVIYGLGSSKEACLTFADGVYTYKNAKDFLSLNVVDGSIVKVGMVYNKNFKNYSAYLIEITGKEELEEEVIPTASNVTKVTSLEQLVDGTKLVFAYKTFLMGGLSGTLLTSIEATQVEVAEGVAVVTLVKSGDNWLLQLDEAQYIYYDAAAGGNKISVGDVTDASAQWTIAITDGILIITNVATPERLLQYNASSPRFVCYKGTQINPTLYVVVE